MAEELRVTAAGDYVELAAANAQVTAAGDYVELGAVDVRVTAAGAYVELGQEEIRVTSMGVYIEVEGLSPPANLTATAQGPRKILLTWMDNNNGESGYLIERSFDGVTGWQQVANLPAETESYLDIGLSPNTRYYYRVRAWRA